MLINHFLFSDSKNITYIFTMGSPYESEQVFVNHLLSDLGMSMFGEYSVDHLCSPKALKNVNENSALILKGNICTIQSF